MTVICVRERPRQFRSGQLEKIAGVSIGEKTEWREAGLLRLQDSEVARFSAWQVAAAMLLSLLEGPTGVAELARMLPRLTRSVIWHAVANHPKAIRIRGHSKEAAWMRKEIRSRTRFEGGGSHCGTIAGIGDDHVVRFVVRSSDGIQLLEDGPSLDAPLTVKQTLFDLKALAADLVRKSGRLIDINLDVEGEIDDDVDA